MNDMVNKNEMKLEDIRKKELDGDVWYVVKDIARYLGYKDPRNSAQRLIRLGGKGGSKRLISFPSGPFEVDQNLACISKEDLIEILGNSRMDRAKILVNELD